MITQSIRKHGSRLLATFLFVGMVGVFCNPSPVSAQVSENIVEPDSGLIPDHNVNLLNQWVRFLEVVDENLSFALLHSEGKLQLFETSSNDSFDQTLALFTNVLQGIVSVGTPEDHLALYAMVKEHNAAVDMMNAYFAQLNAHQEAFAATFSALPDTEVIDFNEDTDRNIHIVGDEVFVQVEDSNDGYLRKSPGN